MPHQDMHIISEAFCRPCYVFVCLFTYELSINRQHILGRGIFLLATLNYDVCSLYISSSVTVVKFFFFKIGKGTFNIKVNQS